MSWWKDNLERLVKSDPDARKEFLDAYLPIFQRWIGRITKDVDDHLADVVMHVFHALPRFEFQRSHSIDGWLKAVLRNRVVGRLRERPQPWTLSAGREDGEDVSGQIRDQKAVDPAANHQPPLDLLQRALGDLSSLDRLLLFVVKVKKIRQREAADVLGATTVWVNRRVNSGLDRLKVRIQELLLSEVRASSPAGRSEPAVAAPEALDTKSTLQVDRLIAFCVDRKGFPLLELAAATGWTMGELLDRIDRMRDGFQHRSTAPWVSQDEKGSTETFLL